MAPDPVRYLVEDRGYETPCWVWQRALNSDGYGVVREGDRLMLAHRVAFRDEHGFLPERLDHLCSVRACMRPSHLEPVTQAQNIQRGRGAKLNAIQVAEIRGRLAAGESGRSLARAFGVSPTHVYGIRDGLHWAEAA